MLIIQTGGGSIPQTLASVTTDNAISRYDGTTGNTQNSVLTIADTTGTIAGFGTGGGLTLHGGGTITGASGAITHTTASGQAVIFALDGGSTLYLKPTSNSATIGSSGTAIFEINTALGWPVALQYGFRASLGGGNTDAALVRYGAASIAITGGQGSAAANLRFGGTNAPTIGATGTSPNESLVLTAGGSGSITTANNFSANNVTAAAEVFVGAASTFRWTGRSRIGSLSDGAVRMTNGANAASASLSVATPVVVEPAGRAVSATESRTIFSNEGATGMATFTLPTAAVGHSYTFFVQDADGITITANTGDTIRFGATVTAAAGSISSTTVGDSITLVAINATEWVATSYHGAWA